MAWWIKWLLDLTWWLLLLVTAVLVIQSIHALATRDASKLEAELNVRIHFDPDGYSISSPQLGIEGAEIKKATGKLAFRNPSGTYAFAVLAWAYLGLGIVLVTLYELRKIFDSLARRAPFEPANGQRLRVIALAILLGQLLRGGMAFAMARGVNQELSVSGIRLEPDWGIDPFSLLFGLIILVLAEIFRIGAKLKEEQDLTI